MSQPQNEEDVLLLTEVELADVCPVSHWEFLRERALLLPFVRWMVQHMGRAPHHCVRDFLIDTMRYSQGGHTLKRNLNNLEAFDGMVARRQVSGKGR